MTAPTTTTDPRLSDAAEAILFVLRTNPPLRMPTLFARAEAILGASLTDDEWRAQSELLQALGLAVLRRVRGKSEYRLELPAPAPTTITTPITLIITER